MSERDGNRTEGRRRYRIGGSTSPFASGATGGHVDDLVPAYALGALDADERALVDRHLRTCQACSRLLDDDLRTVGMLPFMAPLTSPAPDVKVALFARVAHSQRAIADATAIQPGRPAPPALTIPSSRSVGATPLAPALPLPSPARSSRFGWVATALTAPLLIALVAVGMWGIQMRDQASLQTAQVGDLQAQLANFGSGTTRFRLEPSDAAPQAEGTLYLGADNRQGKLAIDLKAQQPSGQSYEVLAVSDDNLVPVGEVPVDERGVGEATVELPQPFDSYDYVQVRAKASPADRVAKSDAKNVLRGGAPEAIGASDAGNDSFP